MVVKDYADYYSIELDCWCHGLRSVTERVDPSVVYKVIKQFTPVLRGAVEKLYVIDVFETADRLIAASRTSICRQEIAFYILSQLPPPRELTSEQRAILAKIIDSVEMTYQGARKRLEKKWGCITPEIAAQSASATLPLKGETL